MSDGLRILMNAECTPFERSTYTRLFRDFLAMGESANSPVRAWYGAEPFRQRVDEGSRCEGSRHCIGRCAGSARPCVRRGPATLANIAKLRAGARAVVTGQQVVLLGGPLLTLLKAATAIARARQASAETGIAHVPIFWLATEDHDREEVEQVSLLSKSSVETLHLAAKQTPYAAPTGNVVLDDSIDALLDRASDLLHHAPICDSAARVLRASARQSRPNLRRRLRPPDDAPLRRATASS